MTRFIQGTIFYETSPLTKTHQETQLSILFSEDATQKLQRSSEHAEVWNNGANCRPSPQKAYSNQYGFKTPLQMLIPITEIQLTYLTD